MNFPAAEWRSIVWAPPVSFADIPRPLEYILGGEGDKFASLFKGGVGGADRGSPRGESYP